MILEQILTLKNDVRWNDYLLLLKPGTCSCRPSVTMTGNQGRAVISVQLLSVKLLAKTLRLMKEHWLGLFTSTAFVGTKPLLRALMFLWVHWRFEPVRKKTVPPLRMMWSLIAQTRRALCDTQFPGGNQWLLLLRSLPLLFWSTQDLLSSDYLKCAWTPFLYLPSILTGTNLSSFFSYRLSFLFSRNLPTLEFTPCTSYLLLSNKITPKFRGLKQQTWLISQFLCQEFGSRVVAVSVLGFLSRLRSDFWGWRGRAALARYNLHTIS